MANPQELISALQHALKLKKIRYVHVAKALGLSESSVKRMFSKGDMTLTRLQEICNLVDLDIGELARQALENRRSITKLSRKQEQLLVQDIKLLLFAYLLASGWSYEEILLAYQYNEVEAIKMLTTLDKMKLIELLPNNKVRMRIARDFQWRKKGPINRFFNEQVQKEFFKTDFSKVGSLRIANNGYISHASFDICHRKMQSLHREIEEIIKSDSKLDKKYLLPITHITAIRPWVFPIFEQFSRRSSPPLMEL